MRFVSKSKMNREERESAAQENGQQENSRPHPGESRVESREKKGKGVVGRREAVAEILN